MKKLLFLIFILTSFNSVLPAQSPLIVKSGSKGLYLEHKVTPKENFYSVGRLYNVHPKELAAYNSLDMAKGLNLGQLILIPLTKTNYSETDDKGIAVFQKPGGKIAGYLIITQTEAPVKKDPEPLTQTPEKKDPPPAEVKKEEVVTKSEPVKQETKSETTAKPAQGFFKTDFEKQVKATPAKKKQTVTAGIFKTTSGWTDAKYYMLIDNVQPGTIVKVINPGNNKTVYAKVLGEMSGIKQNEGYKIRISNAAASALNISDEEKFIVQVNY
jgi:hypothetical protein